MFVLTITLRYPYREIKNITCTNIINSPVGGELNTSFWSSTASKEWSGSTQSPKGVSEDGADLGGGMDKERRESTHRDISAIPGTNMRIAPTS